MESNAIMEMASSVEIVPATVAIVALASSIYLFSVPLFIATCIVFASFCYLSSVYYAGWLPKRYKGYLVPRGPAFRPIIGHLNTIFSRSDLHTHLDTLVNEYGNIIQLQFGQTPAFVLNTMDLVKQVFNNPTYKNSIIRTDFQDTRKAFGRNEDILISNDKDWEVNRGAFHRSMTSALANSTDKKSLIETVVYQEASRLVTLVADGKPFVPANIFIDATFNVLIKTLLGRVATPEEKAVITPLQTDFPKMCVGELIHKVPSFLVNQLFDHRHKEVQVMVDAINNVIDMWIESPASQDCIIARLKRVNGVKAESIRGMVMDMFVAGYDSVKFHLSWFLHLIVMHNKVQQRLQFLLHNSPEKYEEYFEQVYKEVMRYRPIMLSGLWYKNTEDVIVEEDGKTFILPKGSFLFYNTMRIHHNAAFWKDPERFRPSRFTTEDGGVTSSEYTQNYIGFFLGKRSCLGEKMAKMQIKIIITEMLRANTFVSDVPMTDDTFVQTIMAQHPYYLRAGPLNVPKVLLSIQEADIQ